MRGGAADNTKLPLSEPSDQDGINHAGSLQAIGKAKIPKWDIPGIFNSQGRHACYADALPVQVEVDGDNGIPLLHFYHI